MSEQKVEADDLNTQEFVNWKNLECTRRFISWMRGVVEDERDYMQNAMFQGDNAHEDITRGARAQGRAEQAKRTADLIESIHIPRPQEETHEE